jgi:hypothetical protein
MMKGRLVLLAALAIAGCSRQVAVPTEAQFEADPKLLSEWMEKCTHGEYSNLSLDESARMCDSAQAASRAVVRRKAASDSDRLFGEAATRH